MSEFLISDAALVEIRRIFCGSGCQDPVARLYERADAGHLFEDIKIALLEGTKKAADLEAIGKRRLSEVADQLQSSLAVGACERADFQPEHLREVDGITFVMGSDILEMLRDYRLVFDDGRFSLRNADNVAHTLRSIVKARYGEE